MSTKMPNEIRSTYQKKNYEEVVFNLDEFECYACGKMCLVDTDKCSDIWDDEEQDVRAVVYCPYCSFKHRILI